MIYLNVMYHNVSDLIVNSLPAELFWRNKTEMVPVV